MNSMRIKAITPIRVSESELTRRQARYQALSPPSVEVELVNLPESSEVPQRLDSEGDIRASERFVIDEAMQTDFARHDAILPDCVLDPGLEYLESEAPVPTFGILKLSAGFLSSSGHRFAALTRNQPIGEELRSRLESYGYLPHFDRVSVLDLAFEDITNDVEWNKALRGAANIFSGTRTTAIINGCSAVELRPEHDDIVLVVDPTKLALSLLGVTSDSDLLVRPEARRSVGGRT